MDFSALPLLDEVTLKAIGCQKWDDPNAEGLVLWLYPGEWYNHIPEGLMMRCIDGTDSPMQHGVTDDDTRYGALAYGFMRKA